LIVLLAVSAFICILFYVGGENMIGQPRFANLYIIWAYILTGIAVGFTVIFPIIQMISNPKNAKKGLLGLAAMAVVIAVSYAFASGELLGIIDPELIQYDEPSTLKYAGMMLNSIYVLATIAILTMVYSEVSKIFK
jgi:hypothetical protein